MKSNQEEKQNTFQAEWGLLRANELLSQSCPFPTPGFMFRPVLSSVLYYRHLQIQKKQKEFYSEHANTHR